MQIDESKVIHIAYSELDDCVALSVTIKKQNKQLDVPNFMKKSGHYKELK
jgi:hypothetical protein